VEIPRLGKIDVNHMHDWIPNIQLHISLIEDFLVFRQENKEKTEG
jgi:hypothetical protein